MIYFDNAATTHPKPKAVYQAVSRCLENGCGNPGRSGHALSLAASKTLYECRCRLAEMFGCKSESNVVFTLNTTYALNMAIKGIQRRGDHILISNIEHNSVLRPIVATGCDYSLFDSQKGCEELMLDIKRKLTPRSKILVCNHQSNISPLQNPIGAIGRLCRENRLFFIVDAAQSAGILPINMENMSIDALCLAGHKSLYGIQGVGAVIFSDGFRGELARNLHTFAEGGNGVNSLEEAMPCFLPERLEAGTLPTPAIAGLLAGIKEVNRVGLPQISSHLQSLYRHLRQELLNMEKITLYCPDMKTGHTLLFNVKDVSPFAAADLLDGNGVALRAGFHCAPNAHKILNTGEQGALRISLGAFNTLEETDRFLDILAKIIKSPML